MADEAAVGRTRGRRLGGLWVVLVAAALGGCGDGKTVREEPVERLRCDIDGLVACSETSGCGDGASCFEGCCHLACADASDCEGTLGCEGFGCVCDEAICIPTSCSATADCPTETVCLGGICEAPEEREVASCDLAPRWGTVRSGSSLAFRVTAYDREGAPIVPPPPFTLETTAADRASAAGQAIVGGDEAGPVQVEAAVGDVGCVAQVESYGVRDEDELRVLVVDAFSQLSLEGALLQIDGGPGSSSMATDERGVALLPLSALGPPPWTISVFHEAYTYVTLMEVAAEDLRIPLVRNEEGPLAGGFQGRFDSELFDPSRLSFGLAGASIPGNLLDLEVTMLVGPVERVEMDFGGARSADLSAGLVFGLGNTWFKEFYRAQALPGACDDPVASVEGRCGSRVAWGLAGGIPLEDLPIDAIVSNGEVDAGSMLSQLLPSVRRLRSAVVPSFEVEPAPRVDGEPDWDALPRLDLDATQRLSLRVDLRVPELPSSALDGVIALVGAQVPERGLVPLGLTGAMDEGADSGAPTGVVLDPVRGRRGVLDLRFAPMHSGLEGSDYLVIVLAVDMEGLAGGKSCAVDDRSGCTPIAGLLVGRDRLPWGTEVDLGQQGFLPLADQAIFDPEARSLDMGEAVDGATLLRLEVESEGKKWQVYFPADVLNFTLPIPAGVTDRVPSASASLQAMAVDVSLEELVGYKEDDLFDFTTRATRFSTIDLPRLE